MKPRNKIQPLPFVLPALFVYILTVIIPILWSMGYSLFSWNGIGDMKFIGLENYVRMFQDETFREAVVNNLKFVVLGSLFQLCAGLILAILLTHISKGGNILRVIYFIPCIISSMAICQIFSKMLSVQPQGLVCYVMEKLGMEPIALLANSHTALITITLIDGYKYCGLYMIIFYSAFVSISKDVIEAAKLDGANEWQIFWRIGIPLGMPGIMSVIVLDFLEYWNLIEQPAVFLRTERLKPLSLYISTITKENAGVAFVAALVAQLPPLLVFLCGDRYLEQGIAAMGGGSES